MKALLLLIPIFLILMVSPALASNTTSVCLDANTSTQETYLTIDSSELSIEQNVTCPAGCDSTNGLCKPDPKSINIATLGIPLLLVIIAGLLVAFGKLLSDNYGIVKFLMFFVGLLIVVVDTAMVLNIAINANLTTMSGMLGGIYHAIMAILIFVFLLFLFNLTRDLIEMAKSKKL